MSIPGVRRLRLPRSSLLPLLVFALAAVIAVGGIIISPRNGDDWAYLGHIAEAQRPDPNLTDPYMGSDLDLLARYEYNVAVQSFISAVDVFDADPVWLFQKLAPPFLGLLSLAGIYFLLRAAGFSTLVSAVGCLAWVLYFLTSFWDFRLHGGYFFMRLAQDKAISWLVLSPPTLGALLLLCGHVGGTSRRGIWLSFAAFAGSSLLATLVHPMGFVFALAFAAAVIMRSAWQRWGWPDRALVTPVFLALAPAVATVLILRFALPQQQELAFRVLDATTRSGKADFIELAGLPVVDPAFIGTLNFLALGWIALSLWWSRRTPALELAACLYFLVALVFLPGVPNLLAPLISAVGVWRFAWLLPIAAMLAIADLVGWLLAVPTPLARLRLAVVCGLSVLVVAAVVTALHIDDYGDLDSSEPSEAQLELLNAVEAAAARQPNELVVYAGVTISRFIPTYADAYVVSFPLLGRIEELERDGRNRATDGERISRIPTYKDLLKVMAFWDARMVILEPTDALFDAPRPGSLGECAVSEGGVLLVLRSAAGALCPRALASSSTTCGGHAVTIMGTAQSDDLVGTAGPDVIAGLEGGDTIDGGAGDDTICGGPGNDLLTGGAGDDELLGEFGFDRVSYASSGDPVEVDLQAGAARGAGTDSLHDIEGVIGSQGDDKLYGNDLVNILIGRAGRDLIEGRGGPDEIRGNEGGDTMSGGDGVDLCAGGEGFDTADTSCETGNAERVNDGPTPGD